MNKVLKIKIYIIFFIYVLMNLNVYANIKLDLLYTFNLKNDEIIFTGEEKFYIINKKSLYEADGINLVKVFSNINGITGILFNSDVLVIFNTSEIFVLNRCDKRLLWNKQINGTITSTPLLTEKTLFLDKNANILIAFDIFTGSIIWKFEADLLNFTYLTNSKILHTEEYVVYLLANAKIILLSKDTGRKMKTSNIMHKNFIGDIYSKMSIFKTLMYDNMLYVLYDNGLFFIFDLSLGDVVYKSFNFNYNDFLIYKNSVIFLFKNNNVSAYNKFNMEFIWSLSFLKFNSNLDKLILINKYLALTYSLNGVLYFIDLKKHEIIHKDFLKKIFIKKIFFDESNKILWVCSKNNKISLFKIDNV